MDQIYLLGFRALLGRHSDCSSLYCHSQVHITLIDVLNHGGICGLLAGDLNRQLEDCWLDPQPAPVMWVRGGPEQCLPMSTPTDEAPLSKAPENPHCSTGAAPWQGSRKNLTGGQLS